MFFPMSCTSTSSWDNEFFQAKKSIKDSRSVSKSKTGAKLVGFLRIPGEGVFLGNPKDSVWEDGGTLGNIRED